MVVVIMQMWAYCGEWLIVHAVLDTMTTIGLWRTRQVHSETICTLKHNMIDFRLLRQLTDVSDVNQPIIKYVV